MKVTTAAAVALAILIPSAVSILPHDTSLGPLFGGPASQAPAPSSYDGQAGISSLSSCSSKFFAQMTAGNKRPDLDPACQSLMIESNYLFSSCGPEKTAAVTAPFGNFPLPTSVHHFPFETRENTVMPAASAHPLEDRDVESSQSPKYIECYRGHYAKTVELCMPYTGGKSQTIWACCSEVRDASLYNQLDGDCSDTDLYCYVNLHGGVGSWLVSENKRCLNGAKFCGSWQNHMCCVGDPYMPKDPKDRCHWPDQAACAAVGPPRRRELDSGSSEVLAARDPPWAQMGHDGQHGPWEDWEKPNAVSVETLHKFSTSMKTVWVSPTNKTTASPTTSHPTSSRNSQTSQTSHASQPSSHSSQTSTPPTTTLLGTPTFTAYDKQPTVEIHTTGVSTTCTPRVPPTGTAMLLPTTFAIKLGDASDKIQLPQILDMPHGICAFCKDAAKAKFVNYLRFGWGQQQYHDAACCGFPFEYDETLPC